MKQKVNNLLKGLSGTNKELIKVYGGAVVIIILSILFVRTFPMNQKVIADEAAIVEDAELPAGYDYLGTGEWVSDTEWTGFVVDSRGVTGIPGNSKECRIYKMHIYESGIASYSCEPVFEMDGSPSTIPFDGIAFG